MNARRRIYYVPASDRLSYLICHQIRYRNEANALIHKHRSPWSIRSGAPINGRQGFKQRIYAEQDAAGPITLRRNTECRGQWNMPCYHETDHDPRSRRIRDVLSTECIYAYHIGEIIPSIFSIDMTWLYTPLSCWQSICKSLIGTNWGIWQQTTIPISFLYYGCIRPILPTASRTITYPLKLLHIPVVVHIPV